MKKVLYVSNIEVPYRSEFFNQLSEKVDLTVLYERKKSSNRDKKWSESVKSNFKTVFLGGIKYKNEYSISFKIIKYVFSKKYDKVILGCFNSPSQIIALLLLRLFHKEYILNLDGEYFFDGKGIKKAIKRFLLKGADQYLIAGEKSACNLSKYVPKSKIHVYYFSSLTKNELEENSKRINSNENDSVLVVGQYFDYKGLDIALDVAKLNQKIKYKFIGSGNRSGLLTQKVLEMHLDNIEIIPFLQKNNLYEEYQKCKCLLLPSRKECWGLVINEAASFGCPIIASSGSSASVEFLSEKYDIFLVEPNNAQLLYNCIDNLFNMNKKELNIYRRYLINKSKEYSIEKSIDEHLVILNK